MHNGMVMHGGRRESTKGTETAPSNIVFQSAPGVKSGGNRESHPCNSRAASQDSRSGKFRPEFPTPRLTLRR